MFRIKTDIRQYKCETKDKVEKLIRNWVIRPSDLIYDSDGKNWAPIGEHPGFFGLFGQLDEQEKNTPDTVVTALSPYQPATTQAEESEAAEDVDDSDVVEDEPEEVAEPEDSSTPEVAPEDAPEPKDELQPPPSEPAGTEVPISDEVTQMVGRPITSDSEAEDVRETDIFEQEEIAASLSDTPAIPEAPAGVEPPIVSDEVTMMTERTLDMLTTDDSEAVVEDAAEEEAEPADSDGEDEEITGVRARREDDDDADEAEGDEEPADDGDTKTKLGPTVLESGPKLGRHDLPEELFATNEISSPEVQEQIKRLDELAELAELDPGEPVEDEDEDEDDEDDKSEDGGSDLEEDSGIAETWDLIAEDLRTTEELDEEAEQELEVKLEPVGDDFDETDEVDRDDEWDEDTGETHVAAEDFVSDGYNIPLPFPVQPTADDIRLGMPQGRVSRAKKDKTFPAPEPKTLDEMHRRVFQLTRMKPRDQTIPLAAGVLFIVIIIAYGVASC